ncbi:hypothetical protein [Ignicoccus hospitalis]|uniref:Uncharacterized protein n=1 Tax=Ignicoccus hospitalis (strain KIN4/I / DSM 18386 / JCM 14125) TaxID=453591 RepID=A8A8V8_IGNH4|nr:hypothetical protein [Ignicoccus hospitalis]ABU81360.1 hypothetical protein Igni_0176 [Ignicoccus hospitalis KIN4/I]HIH90336.1 hypothetical protein [Desulfurococcaceae archaeon]
MGFWPNKREMSVYYLLKKRFGDRFNLGEGLEVLSPYFSRKVALNIIKRLTKLGLLEKRGNFEYAIVDLEEWLGKRTEEYLEARKGRHSSS